MLTNHTNMANLHLIRGLCEIKKITIRELSNRIGKDESSLQTLMRKGTTNTTTLEEIASVLNVHPGYFFDGNKESSTNSVVSELSPVYGNKNQIGNNNTIVESQAHEIEYLKKLLEEKERTIQILLTK